MIEDHKLFVQPDEDAVLWRYMDLAKFLSMLHTSSLYFSRADKMEDTYEAAVPKHYVEEKRKFLAAYKAKHGVDIPIHFASVPSSELFLSCWYLNQHESAAMWKLYCDHGGGIGICSTLRQLKSALQDTVFPIFAGMVNYIDYETEPFVGGLFHNALVPIIHKRKSFEHEREVRLVIWKTLLEGGGVDSKAFTDGYPARVKLSDMVTRVMVAPTAPAWYKDIVRASLEKFGYPDIPVEQSALYAKPLY